MKVKLFPLLAAVWLMQFLDCVRTEREAEGGGQWRRIYIDSNTGCDNDSCLTLNNASVPCKSLDYAIANVSDSTSFVLNSLGTYFLTADVWISDLSNLTFEGNNNTEIRCHGEGVGLGFINVTNITFEGISFKHCAATRNSSSKDFQAHDTIVLSTFDVALFFYLCRDIVMWNVTVADSPNATGVVMYDTGGTNAVSYSYFVNNTVSLDQAGGGGFYIEFTYCQPGSLNCNNSAIGHNSVNLSSYTFTNVTFANNIARNEGLNSTSSFIMPYHANHQSFGRGGGMCLYLKGNALLNTVIFNNCTFKNNSANYGAGIMVEFQDDARGNNITFNNCVFMDNKCRFTLDSGTGGGGMRLGHYVLGHANYYDKPILTNTISLKHCKFRGNSAMYGGGLSLSPALEDINEKFGKPTRVEIDDVIFDGNIARLGSAVHIYRVPFGTKGVMLIVTIQNAQFLNNSHRYMELLNLTGVPYTEGVGALYIQQVDIILRGYTLFSNNSGSGLAVAGSALDFSDCYSRFEFNVGYNGGAMTLLGSSYILINSNTSMNFHSNVAEVSGGAIYVRYVEMSTSLNCFIRHIDPMLQPDQWGANFTFLGNTDDNGIRENSIHCTSVRPCAWAGGNFVRSDVDKIFCWIGWQYFNSNKSVENCSNEVSSEISRIDLLSSSKAKLSVIPGHTFKLPIEVIDDYDNDLTSTTVFRSTSNATHDAGNGYFWGGFASMKGEEEPRVLLNLTSLGDTIWRLNLNINLEQCPPGLYGKECSCPEGKMYRGILSCDPHSYTVTMKDQNWIGYHSSQYLVGLCPPGFCNQTNNSRIVLPHDTKYLAATVCEANRIDVMCGRCVAGYGPAVNSLKFDCVECNDTNTAVNIIKYVSAVYVPLTVLFVILIVFDIRLTTGPANGFILFSQMVTTTFTLDAYGQIPFNKITNNSYSFLSKLFSVPYGIFNLEFIENLLHPFCLSPRFSTLNVLVLEYGVASFPLVMIVFVTLCLKLKEWCCSRCTRLSSIFHQMICCKNIRISRALLPAFASFCLLSYHKFSLTSAYLQSSQPLVDKDGHFVHLKRVYYAGHLEWRSHYYLYTFYLPSILLSFLLMVFATLLLGYPLTLLERCLSKVNCLWKIYPVDKVHVFFDTFNGCFKIKLRFFSGLYFFFRAVVNIGYITSDNWITQFIVQQVACTVMSTLVAIFQPYKSKYLNYVDILIFSNLSILNTLSLFLYFMSQMGEDPPVAAFVIQYVLIFLPLFYILGFICYKVAKKFKLKCFSNFNKYNRMEHVVAADKYVVNASATRVQTADDDLFERAAESNRYCRSSSPESSTINGSESSVFLRKSQETGSSGSSKPSY